MPVQDSYQPPGGSGSDSPSGAPSGFGTNRPSGGSPSGGASGGMTQPGGTSQPQRSASPVNSFNSQVTSSTRGRGAFANRQVSFIGATPGRRRKTEINPRIRLSDIAAFIRGEFFKR